MHTSWSYINLSLSLALFTLPLACSEHSVEPIEPMTSEPFNPYAEGLADQPAGTMSFNDYSEAAGSEAGFQVGTAGDESQPSTEYTPQAGAQRCELSYECETGFYCYQSYCIEEGTCLTGDCSENQDQLGCLEIGPSPLQFGSIRRGTSATRQISLRACEDRAVTIQQINGVNLPNTMTYFAPSLPLTLQPNQEINLEVTYSPESVGSDSGHLEVRSDDAESPTRLIDISGETRVPSLENIGLHIRLDWDTDETDFDLHLVSPIGQFGDSPQDCSFMHPNPQWGDPNSILDDPFLDVDDVDGFGPENINVTEPAPGVYTVMIHYFSEGRDFNQSNLTVTFLHYGAEVSVMRSRPVSQVEEVWIVAEVEFPGAHVREVDEFFIGDLSGF